MDSDSLTITAITIIACLIISSVTYYNTQQYDYKVECIKHWWTMSLTYNTYLCINPNK